MIRSTAPVVVSLCMLALSYPESTARARTQAVSSPTIIDNDDRMKVNSLDMVVTNHGSIAYDLLTGQGGLVYPNGTSKVLTYAAGIWLGAKVGGEVRTAMGEYIQEYAPGPMSGGTFLPDQIQFHNFPIGPGGAGYSDYMNEAVPQGAPLDSLGNPLLLGDALIWSVFNDANSALHTNIAGGTAPLGVEVQQSVFAFSRSGALGKAIFVKWRLANKGTNQLDSAYVSLWADTDLGDPNDDLAGCDTTMNLGYAYNETSNDNVYGSAPPAIGFHMLHGATVNGADLGMTSFRKYINGEDPTSPDQTYFYQSGRNKDGSALHVCYDPAQAVTTYEVSGLDPSSFAGCSNWVDTGGNDRRLFLSSGPFTMMPGDTQVVIVAIEVGQGTNNFSSIQDLRNVAGWVQYLYDAGLIEPSTAVESSLIESRTEVGANHLVWYVPGSTGTPVTIERRTASSDWSGVAETMLPSGGRIVFDDTDVIPGERYGYRLTLWTAAGKDHTDETWLQAASAAETPTTLRLLPGRPNPSSTTFRIRHYIPKRGSFRLSVIDVHGRTIRTLSNREFAPGWSESTWDGRDQEGRDAASGTYFLRIEGKNSTETQKVVLMR
jgi:hypothetical protein